MWATCTLVRPRGPCAPCRRAHQLTHAGALRDAWRRQLGVLFAVRLLGTAGQRALQRVLCGAPPRR